MQIVRLQAGDVSQFLPALGAVLRECVEHGASVSFLAPFTQAQAEQYFASLLDDIAHSRRIFLAALMQDKPEHPPRLVGTVQLVLAMPQNQPHRAEVAKLLVSPAARGHGVGTALMLQAETEARAHQKTLLVLDTVSGSPAEALYLRLGWTKAGEIPDYALLPNGELCATSLFFKRTS